jgi:hypothetical protein
MNRRILRITIARTNRLKENAGGVYSRPVIGTGRFLNIISLSATYICVMLTKFHLTIVPCQTKNKQNQTTLQTNNNTTFAAVASARTKPPRLGYHIAQGDLPIG